MKAILFKSLIIVFVVFGFGCNDEQVRKPGEVKVVFKAEPTGITIKSAEQSTVVLTFNEAFIGVNEIELELESESSFELEAPGPYAVNLLSGVSDPEIIISGIEPAMYAEFEFTIENTLNEGESVYIEGTASVEGSDYPFIFTTDEEFEVEIEGEGNFEEPVEFNDLWLIYIDLGYLLGELDYAGAEKEENNTIVISPDRNIELYKKVINRLNTSFEFEHEDDDDD